MPNRDLPRTRYYSYQRICEYCKNGFEASRYDARYCSAKCRSAEHNDVKSLKSRVDSIRRSLEALEQEYGAERKFGVMEKNPKAIHRSTLTKELLELRKRLNEILDAIDY